LLIAILAPSAFKAIEAQQQLGRLIGVFDDVTGRPIAGVEVIDLETGTKTLTSESGVATLAFLRAGTSLLQIRKLGYQGKLQPVFASATDTASVTIVLTPLAQSLPAVVTRALAPGDTVRRLELSGFYDRRRSTGAPMSAFVTAEQMERWKVMYLGDVKNYNGRGVCGGRDDVYVNGSLVTGGVWLKPGDSGSKVHIGVEEVAGIETYTHVAELPSAYNRTGPPKPVMQSGASKCVTLIWLK
jgi:hypothetical protein